MRPTPLIVLLTGEPPVPLRVLKPIWADTHHKVNGIPAGTVVLSVAGNALETLPSCDEDIELCTPGRSIAILLVEHGIESCIFRGVIVQQTLKMRRDRVELTLSLRHGLQALVSTHRSQVFQEQNDAAIAGRLLLEQAIPLLSVTGMDTVYDQLVQFRCSDWNFLRCRLNANGVWLFPAPEGVEIMRPVLSGIPSHTLHQHARLTGEDPLIEEGSWSFSEQYQPSALTVTTWDDKAQISQTALAGVAVLGTQAFNAAQGNRLNATPWAFNYSTSLRFDAATSLATGLLMNLQSAGVQGEFAVEGSIDYRLGQTLAIEDYGRSVDGHGIITGIRHRISKEEGWRTTVSVGNDDFTRDATLVPRVTGLHIGVVAPFEEDISGMNRLRVRMPVLGDMDNVLWARFSSPYASQMSGFCFYPETGDEVVVGFFDEDPGCPVILGAMHNPVNRAPIAPSQENTNKALVTNKEGRQFQLSFDTLANAVELASSDNKLTLREGATLESKEVLSVKASSISIEGDKATLSGKSMVNITGAKIDLSH
ncbi:phage baseplate assembly protein V [Paraburkholderia sp. GAS348]|uniref:phage baseplate assembly protein V n=1 Tax=Paraburkholderia sp. GAS348 TaxID=3035132 RepID=UPI003D1F02DC